MKGMKSKWFVWMWVLAIGCSSSATSSEPPTPSPRERAQRAAGLRDLHEVSRLQSELLSHDEVTDRDGQELVLQLARAQTCLSLRNEAPELAEATIEMLSEYEALHDERPGELGRRSRRRIASAKRDAEIASESDQTLAYVRCRRAYPGSRRNRRNLWRRYQHPVKTAWGIDTPDTRSAGGVVR